MTNSASYVLFKQNTVSVKRTRDSNKIRSMINGDVQNVQVYREKSLLQVLNICSAADFMLSNRQKTNLLQECLLRVRRHWEERKLTITPVWSISTNWFQLPDHVITRHVHARTRPTRKSVTQKQRTARCAAQSLRRVCGHVVVLLHVKKECDVITSSEKLQQHTDGARTS